MLKSSIKKRKIEIMKIDIAKPNKRLKAWKLFVAECANNEHDPDQVYYSQQTAKAIVSEMLRLITVEETVVVKEPAQPGELFHKDIEHSTTLDKDWTGWKEYVFDQRHTWFNDFTYFSEWIERNKNLTLEQAIEHSKEVNKVLTNIKHSSTENGSFENSVMLALGLDIQELVVEHGENFGKMIHRVFKVGQAQSKQDTMKAMKKKAIKGDLAAQKTILVHEGALKSDKAAAEVGGPGGAFAVYIDGDDAEL